MITRSAHPAWCESPNAPDDDTHTHTAAVGSVLLPGDITAEMVLAQMPRTPTPLLTLHVTGPARRISVDMTGVESSALAGVLIDATVAHRQAITDPAPPPTRDRSSTRGLAREPSWCEDPQAPSDETHIHTAAIGSTYLAEDVVIELVLVQAPDSPAPVLTLHATTPTSRVSIDVTGAQAWALAGMLIDATVAHARAAPPHQPMIDTSRSDSTASAQQASTKTRPTWLLDRLNRDKAVRGHRTRSAGFRCPPAKRGGSANDEPNS